MEFFDERLLGYFGKILLPYGKESHLQAYRPIGWGEPGRQDVF